LGKSVLQWSCILPVGSAISVVAKLEQKALAHERRTNRVRDLMLNSILINTHFTIDFAKGSFPIIDITKKYYFCKK